MDESRPLQEGEFLLIMRERKVRLCQKLCLASASVRCGGLMGREGRGMSGRPTHDVLIQALCADVDRNS